MVAKKRKTTKKLKDLAVKKVTSAQGKKVKGGGGVSVATAKRGWIT